MRRSAARAPARWRERRRPARGAGRSAHMKRRMAVALSGFLVVAVSTGRGAQTQARWFELDDLARVVRLTDPQVAPDGRSIALVVSRANLEEDRWDPELALVDLESGSVRTLTYDRRGVGQPRWSPTGDHLAFLATVGSGREAHPQVFVMDATGGEARRLTSAAEGVQQFAWSPDGSTIAYAAADEPEKKTGIERFNDAFEVGDDDFLVTKAPTSTHVWLVANESGAARRLTSGTWSLPVSFPPGPPSSPIAWSPDGKSIAIAKVPTPHSGERSQSTVNIVDVGSGAVRPMTSATAAEGYPAFSPDGSQIAYWYPRSGDRANVNEVHVAPAAGGGGRSITAA